jgi:hypothetical protein
MLRRRELHGLIESNATEEENGVSIFHGCATRRRRIGTGVGGM